MPDAAKLALDADLRLECGGQTIRIQGGSRSFAADSPTMGPYRDLARACGSRRSAFSRFRRFSQLLARNGVSLQVRVKDEVVAVCGAGVDNRLGRLVGLRFVQFRHPDLWLDFLRSDK